MEEPKLKYDSERRTLEVSYHGKTKTFLSNSAVNGFIGSFINDVRGRMVSEETYYHICLRLGGNPMIWDDYTEMTPSEWVALTKSILLNFS